MSVDLCRICLPAKKSVNMFGAFDSLSGGLPGVSLLLRISHTMVIRRLPVSIVFLPFLECLFPCLEILFASLECLCPCQE